MEAIETIGSDFLMTFNIKAKKPKSLLKRKPSTKPTGKRILDFCGQYSIPYKVKKQTQPLPVIDKAAPCEYKGLYDKTLGFYSNRAYMINIQFPLKMRGKKPIHNKDMEKALTCDYGKLARALIETEIYINPTGEKEDGALSVTIGNNVFNPFYVDHILTIHPKSTPYVDALSVWFLTSDKTIVGRIMRLQK